VDKVVIVFETTESGRYVGWRCCRARELNTRSHYRYVPQSGVKVIKHAGSVIYRHVAPNISLAVACGCCII